MIVGAGREPDSPLVRRLEPVTLRQPREVLGRGPSASRQASVFASRSSPVAALPEPEQQHHALDVERRDRRAHPVERVRERVCEPALAEERDELVDGGPVRLQVAMVILGQPPDEDVERHVVGREARRHLDRKERARQLGDAESSLEGVVVGDRHQRMPRRLQTR